jgi:hypothetical protein
MDILQCEVHHVDNLRSNLDVMYIMWITPGAVVYITHDTPCQDLTFGVRYVILTVLES